MSASVIVLTYNNLDLNKRCVDSVLSQCGKDDEIIIVDNDSQDSTVDYLKSLTDNRIVTILNTTNMGFAGGCNQGAKIAKGDILVFLNNDTEVKPEWLGELQACLSKTGVGIAGSRLLYPDGRIQHAGIVISSDSMPRHIYRLADPKAPFVSKDREFQAVTAASLAITKEVFDKVGGFDEGYINGLEDIDLCHKVSKLGLKVVYCSKSVATHYESVSKDRFKHYFRNRERYLSKWPNVKSDEDKYYREDGFGPIFIFREHLRNRYFTGNYLEKAKILTQKVLGSKSE